MKITSSLTKLFFAITIYFCIINITFSQEKKFLFDGSLWIKGIDYKIENYTNPLNEEELALKKYFNYNPSIEFSKDKILKKYKNLITKSSSLFVVFKSSLREENVLLSMERGSFKSSLSNKKMVCNKDVILNKGNSATGVIVSYLFNKNSLTGKKNGNLLLEDLLFEDKEFKNQFLELIYIPKFIDDKEKSIIESYLSLKYGISLNEGKSYYNSKGFKIWDVKQNEGYNYNITGIGKDDYIGLNQKQSKNSLQDGLSIGLEKIMNKNIENENVIKDKEYIMWGDNGKNVVLEKNVDGTQKRMKRVWKIKPISDSITKFSTQLKIDKKLMPIEINFDINDPEFIWLAVDNSNTSEFNYANAKYIKATINNENQLIFDTVEFNSNSDYLFTIVKSKEDLNNQNSILSEGLLKQATYDTSLVGQFMVYPNPVSANERFNIKLNLKESSNVLIKIADSGGKVIKTKKLDSIKRVVYQS